MDYFYCNPDDVAGDSLVIRGEEFAHLTHVMRKQAGDRIVVVDGRGTAYDVRIESLEKKAAACRIESRTGGLHEPAVKVVLAAGILKNPSRFDFLVEKATELGVTEIVPLVTERTIPPRGRITRWRKLALAAMKQSGRSVLPPVRDLTTLVEALEAGSGFDRMVVAHEKGPAGPDATPGSGETAGVPSPGYRTLLLLIGPEGGFSEAEVELCVGKGCEVLYLGERRLRTETAAVAALARIIR